MKSIVRQIREIETHMREKQPTRKPTMSTHQMAATTEHEKVKEENQFKLERGKLSMN